MKSKSTFLYLVALVFAAYSCSPKGDGTVSTVEVEGHEMFVFSYDALNSRVAIVPLSNLVESVDMVQLESRDDAYFNPKFTTVTEKYIGVQDYRYEPFKLFDRSGKFLCKVGSIGGGPGEYALPPYDVIIDEKNELIYLAPTASDHIFVYNISGEFVKIITAPHRLKKAKLFLTDNVLTVVNMPFKGDVLAMQFDVNSGQILNELDAPTHLIVQNVEGEIFSTKNTPGIFDVLNTSSDTLYHFDVQNNKFLPVFMLTHNLTEKPWKQYFQVNKDLIMTWMEGKLHATDLKNKISSNINVVNDYYGNMPALLSVVHTRNGYWVHNIQPEQLMDDIEKRLAESSCTESDRQILNTTLSTLKEGANNVVFLGKLKQDVSAKLW